MVAAPMTGYPARFDLEYTEGRDRVTVLFRLLLAIPVVLIMSLITSALRTLGLAVALMLFVRGRYPRPWFDWYLYASQFTNRVSAYVLLLTDEYPSTTDQQRVTTEADLDEAQLSRWLPLVKWLLAIPHYIVLALLLMVASVVLILAWFIILITGRMPRGMFDFLVGIMRWTWRVTAYVALLSTDRYPPFSLK